LQILKGSVNVTTLWLQILSGIRLPVITKIGQFLTELGLFKNKECRNIIRQLQTS